MLRWNPKRPQYLMTYQQTIIFYFSIQNHKRCTQRGWWIYIFMNQCKITAHLFESVIRYDRFIDEHADELNDRFYTHLNVQGMSILFALNLPNRPATDDRFNYNYNGNIERRISVVRLSCFAFLFFFCHSSKFSSRRQQHRKKKSNRTRLNGWMTSAVVRNDAYFPVLHCASLFSMQTTHRVQKSVYSVVLFLLLFCGHIFFYIHVCLFRSLMCLRGQMHNDAVETLNVIRVVHTFFFCFSNNCSQRAMACVLVQWTSA